MTISISGTPARLKSTTLYPRPRVLHARRVLLEVRAGDADGDLAALGRHRHRQPAVAGQRQGVLADLVALRQVRVEVVLALEADRIGLDVAVEGQAGEHHQLDGAPVDDRQRARHAHADGADARVRLVRPRPRRRRRAGAEHLGLGPQLGVDLDPDDRLVPRSRSHRHASDCTGAILRRHEDRRVGQPRAGRARCSSASSASWMPRIRGPRRP